MAKLKLSIPDGLFCSDKSQTDCLYKKFCAGAHTCTLFSETCDKVEFRINGERRRSTVKCNSCNKLKVLDTDNGLVPDDNSLTEGWNYNCLNDKK